MTTEMTTMEQREKKMEEIQRVNGSMIDHARQLASAITDELSLKSAIDYGQEIDRRLDWVIEYWKPLIDDAHRQHKALIAKRDELKIPLEEVKKIVLGRPIAAYIDARNRRMADEQRKRDEQLRKAAEDERIAEAAELEKEGQHEAAKLVLDEPIIPQRSGIEKVKDSVSIRGVWTFEITNPALIPREFLAPDEQKIRKHVKTWQDKTTIPGVRIWEEKTTIF